MFNNLSDGESNGIVLFYMRDKVLFPVALSEEQANALDLTISIPFHEKGIRVVKQKLNVKDGVII